ncbi:ligand of Numb protein X 2 isoform X1 [Lepeophtheirus salmonis]|uniref:ligand of Numb protein X 2 isoform X1 n=1 Tax=Lepeophtheirus salmonis TaxID=72036 RepID=UPI001AE58EC3|nr:ligand of Numb protein X 2-like isoform X1 [Lepeophtheirus salmonis]XP_040580098.1 ligand of Numb protein X 2-like isoform X1 [Lepeophtheirus salmonis]XP_040580099.1 ligand of Numb protein X 2-like isoform X1 [Lepeophtheirus salmonis]
MSDRRSSLRSSSRRASGREKSHSTQTTSNNANGTRPKVCRSCGQHHSHHEPHLYNYKSDVDEDLMCQICLQPFVDPLDTPCSHTFCKSCLHNYLKVNPLCPLDRKPLNEMTCSPSNLVLKKLLDKILVTCPNADSCEEILQRGNLEDHLKYRCSGTMVACQFASAGCEYRGPSKSMSKHQTECNFKKEGITRLPILEGEVSHVEIPRTNSSLGITIVGGADTPLRCVVVQEVFPDGLVAQDGRLQPGDQIIEINGIDMTCASHSQVCASLRKMSSVLRLGVYRERIEKYGARPNSTGSSNVSRQSMKRKKLKHVNESKDEEGLFSFTLERLPGKQLGLRLSGNCSETGIFIVDIQKGSTMGADGRLQIFDRILYINGTDVRNAGITQASALIQNNDKVSLVVVRRKPTDPVLYNYDKENSSTSENTSSNGSCHTRSKSAPAPMHNDRLGTVLSNKNSNQEENGQCEVASSTEELDEPYYDNLDGDDLMGIYETLDRKRQESKEIAKSHSMEALETPDKKNEALKARPKIPCKTSTQSQQSKRQSFHEIPAPSISNALSVEKSPSFGEDLSNTDGNSSMAAFIKRALRIQGPCLLQKTVIVKKNPRESLGMRIGGGIGSNEGDTPIYIANIHPHGCIGKSKQMKKGDILLTVNETSLYGLTHSQAVSTLKATINLSQVSLGILDGPETSFGASNFIPSWMYWQKMPRELQYPKTVILHRREHASWGFSIVGGTDSNGRPTEPIHVLFVVPDSPAAKDGRIRCGDRLLAVDGHTLENIPHSVAVGMLKQTSTRVVMEVVSWMGTEL